MTPYYENKSGKLYNCDVLEGLRSLADNSVDLIVTSPPYWGLRDYGVDGQIGLEPDFNDFLKVMSLIFAECHRVLKPEGNLYVNMGDSYAGSGKGTWANKDKQKETYVPEVGGAHLKCKSDLPAKNLIGQPWRLAFALQGFAVMPFKTISEYADMLAEARHIQDWSVVELVESLMRKWVFLDELSKFGWLREDIIWHKNTCTPESVTDRCTRTHEYIFHFTKSSSYYFEQMLEPATSYDTNIRNRDITKLNNTPGRTRMGGLTRNDYEFRNKRSVWTVSTERMPEAHFATFPKDLISPIVQAACPQGGLVLDIFGGSGTTAVVAELFQRQWLLFELNPSYCDIAQRRIESGDNLGRVKEPEGLTIMDFLKEEVKT